MKKEHAQKWVEALRSGKYEQGNNWLKREGRYCCLGVLNEIFPELDLAGAKEKRYLNNYMKIGLEGPTGSLCDSNSYCSLADLNDSGFTFDEIADIIQIEYVEGL